MGLSLKPQHPAPDCWYYEENKGLDLFYQPPAGHPQRIALIPWRMVRSSLRRRDATAVQPVQRKRR